MVIEGSLGTVSFEKEFKMTMEYPIVKWCKLSQWRQPLKAINHFAIFQRYTYYSSQKSRTILCPKSEVLPTASV